MFLTGLMPENKVRTSDKKKKRKEKYIYLYIIFHNCGFLKGLLEPATPQKEMIIIVIKKNNNNDNNDDDDDDRSAFK